MLTFDDKCDIFSPSNKVITLSREVEGRGPMKPGNRQQHAVTVPIPAEEILRDEESDKV